MPSLHSMYPPTPVPSRPSIHALRRWYTHILQHPSRQTKRPKEREKKKRFAASGLVQGPYSASLDLSTTMLMDSNSSRKSRCSPPFLASFSPVAMAVYGAVLSALDRRVFSSVLPSCAAGWF